MAWYRCGGGGLPAGLQSDMDTVLNKKFSTSTTYPPTDWPDNVNLLGPLPEKTASGAIASFSDGADDVPMKSVVAHIAPTLTGTNAVNMVQSGKNLLQNLKYQATTNRVNIGQSDDGFSVSLKKGTYTLSVSSSINISAYYRGELDGSNTLIWSTYSTSGSGTFTLSEDKDVRMWVIGQDGSVSTSDVLTIQLEVGSTATAYEPYVAPTTYTANLGRTIYGGTADIVTGEGTDEYSAPITLDGTENWQKHGSIASWFYVDNLLVDAYANNSETGFIGSSWGAQKPYSQVSSLANGEFAYGAINRLVFKNTDFTEVADFKNWLSSNPITLVYKITTANTFTFDGQEIPSMLGVNNLWHDAGETECTYRADISLALQAINGGRGLMMMRPTEPEETEETEETEGLEDELNR